jgi:hypothetical protein
VLTRLRFLAGGEGSVGVDDALEEARRINAARWTTEIRRAYDIPDIIVRDDQIDLVNQALVERVSANIDPDIQKSDDPQKCRDEIERIINVVAEDEHGIRDRFILDFPVPFG